MNVRALLLALFAGLAPTGAIYLGLFDGATTSTTQLILFGAAALGVLAVILAIVDRKTAGTALTVIAPILALAGAAWNVLIATFTGVGHGRPFRVGGRAVTARAAGGETGWLEEPRPSLDGLDPSQREALAARWTRDALAEHASVAAFARVVLDLLAVGAPASLVEAATAAQRDEIVHARLCFALASAYAGKPLGPGAFPEAVITDARPLDLAVRLRHLGDEALRDGCGAEQASADACRREAAAATDPAVVAVLTRLADDEDRHAALAREIVDYCEAMKAPRTSAAIARSAS